MFDIRYYMCRRVGENFVTITKDTFKLCFDKESQMAYVIKVENELTNNQREKSNIEIVTGVMTQILGRKGVLHKLCPERPFENYTTSLNPECNSLWQKTSISNYRKGILPMYENSSIGKNPLATFMSKLSNICGLSKT